MQRQAPRVWYSLLQPVHRDFFLQNLPEDAFFSQFISPLVEVADLILERLAVLPLQLSQLLGDGDLQKSNSLLKRLYLESSAISRL